MRTLLAIVALLLLPWTALAQVDQKAKFEGLLNKLLAPGPLMIGHENLEHKDCLKCHEPGGGVPNNQCLDCHKPIHEQVKANKNFHGLMNGKPCIDCHKEHKGRDFNSQRFDENTFDHSRTGWKLEGGHAKVQCAKCHTEKRDNKPIRKTETRFFGKSQSCLACHKTDDIHFFEGTFKGKECSTCHTPAGWKQVQAFDHGRETGHALIGAHAKHKCSKCHVSEGKDNIKYEFPGLKTKKCLTCHKEQHGDNFGPRFRNAECTTCHSTAQDTWKIQKFNHDTTGFPLLGTHATIQCVSCHKQNSPKSSVSQFNFKGLTKSCASCHKDYHGYGRETAEFFNNSPLIRCETCHNESKWKQSARFNHDRATRFTLDGKHLENSCFDCHIPKAGPKQTAKPNVLRTYFFKDLAKKSCETCHKSPHPEAFRRKFKGVACANCHTTQGWDIVRQGGTGDFHSKTRFPLTGKHQKVECKACHNVNGKEVYKFPNADKDFCVNCHKTPHKNQFSEATVEKSCATCHTTSSFDKRPPFDHDTTAFKITGKHKLVENECVKCHVPTAQKLPLPVPKTAHLFKFDKAKDPNLCLNCHVSPHKKQFSEKFSAKSCSTCHTTNGFDKQLNFNHDQTDFKLTGAHEKLAAKCGECHKPDDSVVLQSKPPRKGRLFLFPGESRGYCENCHVNEHKNMFDPKFVSKPCTSCHVTESFANRKKFDHDTTDFELKGKHQKVRCEKCHTPTPERYKQASKRQKGKYEFPDLSAKNCATCHTDPHKGSNGPLCTKCHNESGFKNAGDFHKDMELIGVHLQLECKSCHDNGRILRGSSQECSVCHSKDDNHSGSLPQCGQCHMQNFWNQTLFDHNLLRFPLTGAHRVTECRACHNQGTYLGLPTDCRGCHANQALAVPAPNHNNPRYFSCDRCHTTFSFPGAQEQ